MKRILCLLWISTTLSAAPMEDVEQLLRNLPRSVEAHEILLERADKRLSEEDILEAAIYTADDIINLYLDVLTHPDFLDRIDSETRSVLERGWRLAQYRQAAYGARLREQDPRAYAALNPNLTQKMERAEQRSREELRSRLKTQPATAGGGSSQPPNKFGGAGRRQPPPTAEADRMRRLGLTPPPPRAEDPGSGSRGPKDPSPPQVVQRPPQDPPRLPAPRTPSPALTSSDNRREIEERLPGVALPRKPYVAREGDPYAGLKSWESRVRGRDQALKRYIGDWSHQTTLDILGMPDNRRLPLDRRTMGPDQYDLSPGQPNPFYVGDQP